MYRKSHLEISQTSGSVVLQKNVLFFRNHSGNTSDGVDKNAPEEECRRACQLAVPMISSTKMPGHNNKNLPLKQGGSNVFRRPDSNVLCIARALLKKPKILILE